jgi:cytochrome oxidase Cu insertion factor (SCO1/SenC/PrrC family)
VPGMNSGLSDTNPVLVAAFKAALLHQGLAVVLLLAVMALAWLSVRQWLPAGGRAPGPATVEPAAVEPAVTEPTAIEPAVTEPVGRRTLRIGFGILWILDGLLQAQSAMPAGLPGQVIAPAAAGSPGWVQHLVNWAGTTWSYHPIQAGAAAVWIQVGIGAWLVAAGGGRASRLAGLASAGWGAVVWIFGEALGGIFAPGLSVLYGAPGAAALYLAGGLLIALPGRCWQTARTGRRILDGLGLFFIGMAVVQAWPGRGFWSGTAAGRPGALASMARAMAAVPQPRFLAGWVNGFGSLAAAHGFAVNLATVIALAVAGAGLLSSRPRLLRPALLVLGVFCLADWVLVQDLGFLGGLGTDPNSMIPIALVAAGGYLAVVRVPAAAGAPIPARPAGRDPSAEGAAAPAAKTTSSAGEEAAPAEEAEPRPTAGERAGLRPAGRRAGAARLARAVAAAPARVMVAAWAAAVVVVGAAPMAMAQASPQADPIIARAIAGSYAALDVPAPAFRLTDQNGAGVSLARLRGKVVLLTFLDPVCTSDCPLIAQEFRQADQVLGRQARHVELVAIVANPLYRGLAYTRAFDRQESLTGLPNWRYLTGPAAQLTQAWRAYDVSVGVVPAGGMVAHPDIAFVISARGRIRAELDFDPGPGTASSVSSFAAELTGAARQALRSP